MIFPISHSILETAVQYLEYFHSNVVNVEQFDAEYVNFLNAGGNVTGSSAVTHGQAASKAPVPKVGKKKVASAASSKKDAPLDLSVRSGKKKRKTPTSSATPRPTSKSKRLFAT